MSYVIYGAPGWGSCLVEAACAEIGVAYVLRDLDVRAGEHRGEAYRAINPQRKIPTVQIDGGEILTESVAIVLTLDERHPEAGLLPPPGSPERAQALRWMLFIATELYPTIEWVDHPGRLAPSPEAEAPLRERAKEIWRERWQVVEAQLTLTPYLLGPRLCATDLYIALMSRWDMDPEWRRQHLPRIEALTAAARARPALAMVWARHFPEVSGG